MPMGDLARQDELGGFDYGVDPDLTRYDRLRDSASNMSVQPPYARPRAVPDARWVPGAIAAQDAYNADEGDAPGMGSLARQDDYQP